MIENFPRTTVSAARPPAMMARNPDGAGQHLDQMPWLIFLLLHIPLVAAIRFNVFVATAHALGTVAIGIGCLRYRNPERLLCVMGYIVASEPLWRVGRALVFHETAKYALALLSILALGKYRRDYPFDRRALLYFVLLLPSLAVLPEFDRRAISFNLSGPLVLAASTAFLSTLRLDVHQLRKLFLTILGPILGLAFIASFSTLQAEEINFYQSKIASGGLGQNQASSILGLGVLLAFFFMSITPRSQVLRAFVGLVGLWCGIQGALTFSRGGVVTALAAMATTSVFLLRDRRQRGFLLVRLGLITLVAVNVAIPLLNSVTSGAFEDRFSDSRLTGRDKIMQGDMIAFRENPLFGVGPGMSKDYHALTFRRSSAHTEYTRMVAEHGLFGVGAFLLLAKISLARLRRRVPHIGKALASGLTAWALLFMFHAAMRMAAVSFIFALGAAFLMAENPHRVQVRRRYGLAPEPGSRRLAKAVHR